MFEKLKMARYLKAKGSPQEVVVGFAGRVSRIARVHQYGLRDRADRNAPEIDYPRRALLGLRDAESEDLRDLILAHLSPMEV